MLCKLCHVVRHPCVLPDDCVVNGFSRLPVPDHSRFALVGNTDSGKVGLLQLRGCHRTLDHTRGFPPDLIRIVLDPAGLGINLLVLFLRAAHDLACTVEYDESRTRRTLINRAYELCHSSPVLAGRLMNSFRRIPLSHTFVAFRHEGTRVSAGHKLEYYVCRKKSVNHRGLAR